MVMPGDNLKFGVELIAPIAMEEKPALRHPRRRPHRRRRRRLENHRVRLRTIAQRTRLDGANAPRFLHGRCDGPKRRRAMQGQNIRIRLKAFDYRVLDASTAGDREHGQADRCATCAAPFRCRTRSRNSRCCAARTSTRRAGSSSRSGRTSGCLDIVDPTPQTVDALMKLDLAAGVDVEIKL